MPLFKTAVRDGALIVELDFGDVQHVPAGEPYLCHCGSPIAGTCEVLDARADIDDPTDENGMLPPGTELAWNGHTEMFYESQETISVTIDGTDYPVLMCENEAHYFTHGDVTDIGSE